MKRAVLISAIFIAGCATIDLDRETVVNVADFTPYAEQGFLFTPTEYRGDYEARGLLSVTVYPKVETKESGTRVFGGSMKEYSVEELGLHDALQAMFEEARDLGADAVMGVDFGPVSDQRSSVSGVGYTVSGFAIKRLGAFSPPN